MHGHDHGDRHAHDRGAHEVHRDDRARGQKSLFVVLGLSVCYLIAEAIGGVLSHSLALLADAGHMLSDVAALSLTLFAAWIARRPASSKRTYGYYRAEMLAALFNGATLIAIAILIVVEAFERLRSPAEVHGTIMVLIASGGLVVNLVSLWVLNRQKTGNLNMRAAWLHVFADALGSVGAIVAGILIWTMGWLWTDSVTSTVIAALVVWSSWSLVRQSVNVLMEGAPAGIDVDDVRDAIVAVRGVREVHDLHVWSISSGLESLSAHVIARSDQSRAALLGELQGVLRDRFGIRHVTLQIEDEHCGVQSHAP